MSDPANTLNDGGIKFIRQLVTALDSSGSSTQYICKKGSMKRGVKRTTSENENGVENKQNFAAQIPSGSLTLQFVNPTDLPPKIMQTITVKDTTNTNQNVIIGEVSDEWSAGEEATVTCEIYAKQS